MKYKLLFLISLIITMSACDNFLDVVPKDKQTEQQIYATRGGFYTVVNGIYNNIASNALYGRNLTYEMIEFLGKRYTYNSGGDTYFSALNSLNYSSDEVERVLSSIWSTAYNTILNCNVVLSNIEKTDVLSSQERAVMKGEMFAIRAFLHFDMLRLFGPIYKYNPNAQGIPYGESATVISNPIISADSVLKYKILPDLNKAIELLKANDPVITEGPMASLPDETEVYLRYRQLRLNYYAVVALRARVNLYAEDKTQALADAKTLLDNPEVHSYFPAVDPNRLLGNNRTPDRIFSTEVLWAIYRKDRTELYERYFNYESAGIYYYLQPRDYLASNIFAGETHDYRFQSQWTVTSGNAGHDFIKYKPIERPNPNNSSSEYFYAKLISLVRLQELYYIAAESEPDFNNGYKWLNKARVNRGVSELTAVSEYDLMGKLRNEYIREFSGEGQVFYMYKRMGSGIPATENGSANSNINISNANFVPPIPASEVENR